MQDLHLLPRFQDGWGYLYVEHCRIDQQHKAIVIHDAKGSVPVPCANLAVLLLGPGTSITHAAVAALADNGCLAAWCGEHGIRFYAQGMGETRSSSNLLHQVRMWADEEKRLSVVVRMYEMRFGESLPAGLTLRQIRGKEGARVRDAYARASRESGVRWNGRVYNRESWDDADPLNRALSAANSCLYGICHAAIVSAGWSPSLGFIHTGKMLSFVYDIADLYKTDVTVPLAFQEASKGPDNLESRVRRALRDLFNEKRLLARIIPDIAYVLDVPKKQSVADHDSEAALPGDLWDPLGMEEGGRNYAEVTASDRDDP